MTLEEYYIISGWVEEILKKQTEPLTIKQIESLLIEGSHIVDNFDLRQTIWEMVGEERAKFTPGHKIERASK